MQPAFTGSLRQQNPSDAADLPDVLYQFDRRHNEDGIWLLSFMQYHLGYIDLEEKSLQPLPSSGGT